MKKRKLYPRAPHKTGIGAYARMLIRNGKTNQEVLAAIHRKFPVAETKMGNICWYRNELRRELGEDVIPTAGELRLSKKKAA